MQNYYNCFKRFMDCMLTDTIQCLAFLDRCFGVIYIHCAGHAQ